MLSIPYDLQEQEYPWDYDYRPSQTLLPQSHRVIPDPSSVAEAATRLMASARPVIIAGRGAVTGDAGSALRSLGERVGALLATTLRGKGSFDDDEFDLGICGAFSTPSTRQLLADADLVLGVGARLGYFTTEAGYMFPNAEVIQIDTSPVGFIDGQRVADLAIAGDARVTLEAIETVLSEKSYSSAGYRTEESRRVIRDDVYRDADYEIQAGTMDPRVAIRELNEHLPRDWRIVVGAGHFWNFVVAGLTGRRPEQYVFTYDFGVIGQGLPVAIGAGVGFAGDPLVLIEGDGSILMNIEELECMSRHHVPCLVFILNDGAFGAEVHKMRAKGYPDDAAKFGFPDLQKIADGFGLRAHHVDSPLQIPGIIEAYRRLPEPTLVDIRISPNVVSRQFRRVYFGHADE